MVEIKVAKPYWPLLNDKDPYYKKRYLVYYGGRGSAKSTHAAIACLIRGTRKKELILCARQFQNSIKDSVMSLLEQLIIDLGLQDFYVIRRDCIIGRNGTLFIFKGLHNNLPSIRSVQGVTICWIEEAQTLTEKAWETLIPTIRAEGSQFIITYNIDLETDPTYQRFNVSPPPGAHVVKVNFNQNPFFPEVLRQEMEYCRGNDTDAYMHIWEGEPRIHSDAQIFNGKWIIDRFETPPNVQFMHGIDFGFSVDPTAAVRCYVHENCLYIYQEAYRHRLELDETAGFFMRAIPGIEKFTLRADNARPESISHLQRHGLPKIIPVEKWKGSVEDGIAVLRAFKKIIIHESCKHMIQEAKLYSYKVHDKTGDILLEVLDKNNHLWDAVRYACAPLIKQSGPGMGYFHYYSKLMAEAEKKPDPR
jgi:phage terminase large subunit